MLACKCGSFSCYWNKWNKTKTACTLHIIRNLQRHRAVSHATARLSRKYKKAVLSQRWPRNASYRPTWCPENFLELLTIPNIFHELMFGSTLWMFLQNLKSVALPVPEIIGGTQKIWAVPGYAHTSFSPKFLTGFYSDWPCTCTRQIWSP